MSFRIEKNETVNKTFRLPKSLVEEMEKLCDDKNISLNRLTILCIEYALKNLED